MTINQCAPGCELGRPGEGAVARCSRGKIDNTRCGGGDRLHFLTGRSKIFPPPPPGWMMRVIVGGLGSEMRDGSWVGCAMCAKFHFSLSGFLIPTLA
jgi:hypothetical protein